MQMLLWRKINSGETIVFTKIILLRESALERAKCFFLFINYKWGIFKETGVAITTNPPQKINCVEGFVISLGTI